MNQTSIWEDFKTWVLRSDNTLYHLIALNVFIFVALGLLNVLVSLFIGPLGESGLSITYYVYKYLGLSFDLGTFITRPWSLVTYMFIHSFSDLFHLIFNMLILYWFGRIFQEFLGNRKLLVTYLIGGLSGGLLYMALFQLPGLQGFVSQNSTLVGASAGVLAVLVAAATLVPEYEMRLIFFGSVKIKYIALFLVLMDLLMLTSGNTGGHIAHLGGAIWGMVYIKQLQAGNDMGDWLDKALLSVKQAFKPSSDSNLKAHKGGKRQTSYSFTQGTKTRQQSSTKTSNSRSAASKKDQISQDEVDQILDKIAQSGYESLSSREKEILFRASGDEKQ